MRTPGGLLLVGFVSVVLVASMWIGAEIARWYFGLEWLGLGTTYRIVMSSAVVGLALAAYLFWLWSAYSRETASHSGM